MLQLRKVVVDSIGDDKVLGIVKKIMFEIKMLYLDTQWRMFSFNCWGAYPPSFYYRYTDEERAKMWEKEKVELLKILEGFED